MRKATLKTKIKTEVFAPPKVMVVILLLLAFALGMTFMLAFLGGLTQLILSKGLSS